MESLGQTTKNGIIVNARFLHPLLSKMFRLGNSVSVNYAHYFLVHSSSSDKVPLGSINELMDSTKNKDVLHNIVWNAT